MIEAYLSELTHLGQAKTTLRLRRRQLTLWAAHCRGRVAEATKQDVVEFLGRYRNPATRASNLSALSGLYKWAVEEGLVMADPTARVRVKRPRGIPQPIPDALIARAMDTADPITRAILVLARFAGLRACEIARVHSSDLRGPVLMVRGKGGVLAEVPAHPEVVKVVSSARGWLLPSPYRRGRPWRAGSVSQRANDHLDAIAPGWTLHKFRHRFVTAAYKESGHDLLVAQQLARHASVATTQGYAKVEDERAGLVVAGMHLAS